MLNFATIKAEAEKQTQAVTNTEVTMDMLFNAVVKRPLTAKGFHNFEIEHVVGNLPQSLTFEGRLVDDDRNILDQTVYTITLRPFGDCTVFKTMVQDIIDQTELKNITLANIGDIVNSTICLHVGENARGYAVYHFNQNWLVNQYVMEQNASMTE